MLGFLLFALTGERRRLQGRSCSRIMRIDRMATAAVIVYEAGLFCSLYPDVRSFLQPAGQPLLFPACICIAAAGYLMGHVCMTSAGVLMESPYRGRVIASGIIAAFALQFILNPQVLSKQCLLLFLAAGMPLLVYLIKQIQIISPADSEKTCSMTAGTVEAVTEKTGTARHELILTSLLTAVFVFLLCYYDIQAAGLAESGSAVIYGLAGMSLFYFFLGTVMVFYYASFWKLAFSTAHPSFRVIRGRLIEKTVTIGSSLLLAMLTSPIGIAAIYLAAVAFSIILSVTLLVQNLRAAETEAAARPETEPETADPMDLFCEKYALTKREREVLERLLVSDESVQEMADALFISKRVLQRHTEALYEKTGCRTRIGLINLYYRGE